MRVVRRLDRILVLLALVPLLAQLVGCDEERPAPSNHANLVDTAWRERCDALETTIREERARTAQAVREQAGLRSAMGWLGTATVVCLVVGVVLGSTTKRDVRRRNADENADKAAGEDDDTPEPGSRVDDRP